MSNKTVHRGEVYMVELGHANGIYHDGMKSLHPVIVVQKESQIEVRKGAEYQTVLVVPCTSNCKIYSARETESRIRINSSQESCFRMNSVALCNEIMCIDVKRFKSAQYMGTLSNYTMSQVLWGIASAVDVNNCKTYKNPDRKA